MVRPGLLLSPDLLPRHRMGIGIKKNIITIKNKTLFRFIRSSDAVSILQIFYIEIIDKHGIRIPETICFRKGKHRKRFLFPMSEKKQLTGCAPMGRDGKIYTFSQRTGSIYTGKPRPHSISGNHMQTRFFVHIVLHQ